MAEYIDKRKLMDDLNRFAPECRAALLIAERQTTAEVEPVRHGQFFRTGRIISCDSAIEIQCSECEETHLVDAIRLETATRYCPYCGAKWTGGADNG